MATTDHLNIKVTLENAASRGIDQAKRSVQELGKTADRVSRKELTQFSTALTGIRGKLNGVARGLLSLKGLVTGVGVGLLAKSFISAADAAENYRVRLKVVLRSQREANLMFKEVGEYASTVSFEYKDLLESATRLSGVMSGGGKEVKKYLPIIADLAAATGVGIQEATGQIIRMYSAGAASADLFRERGVLSMLGFQAGVKYTAEETRKQLIAAFEEIWSKQGC